jgi:hypothetical protein
MLNLDQYQRWIALVSFSSYRQVSVNVKRLPFQAATGRRKRGMKGYEKGFLSLAANADALLHELLDGYIRFGRSCLADIGRVDLEYSQLDDVFRCQIG